MAQNIFSAMELDAIGEMMNISLGSSATAVSNLLDHRVDITTPKVTVVPISEFTLGELEPAIGVEIKYVSGLEGSNIMLLKRSDVKAIVELLMGTEIPEEEFELNELTISAVCELMNQMMGASSTALSEFLGKMVNISTPISFPIESEHEFVEKYFDDNNPKVVVGFTLKIADKLESEFFNVMPIELAKSLVEGFIPNEEIAKVEEEKQENLIAQEVTAEMKAPDESKVKETISDSVIPEQTMESVAPQMPQMSGDASMMQMQMMQQMMMQMQMMQQKMEDQQKASEPRLINVQTASSPAIAPDKNIDLAEGQAENMELIMGVPLELSVEIGRTKKLVKDILDFTKGSLVVLDKLAGEQVDLFVNGQCIAKGDVVVVEDNFGIRITEIMKLNLSTLE